MNLEKKVAEAIYNAIDEDDPEALMGNWQQGWNGPRFDDDINLRLRAVQIDGYIDFRFVAQKLVESLKSVD